MTQNTNQIDRAEYVIETNRTEKTITILSDSDGILDGSLAMEAVDREIGRTFGSQARTIGRGRAEMRGGREAGWTWIVRTPE